MRKFISLISLILLLGFGAVASFSQTAPRKFALLIGISQYYRGKNADYEWWNLNSAPDIKALSQVLQTKFGFKPEEIRTLQTKPETTRDSILNAFKTLVSQVQPGDIVYLHYSGHGSQILDDNGDELDGLDESLVPSDYVTKEDGSRNIRDDEIGKFLDELKAKNPASVTFTFDSCFSGTVTRGGRQLVRGESYQGKRPVVQPNTRGGNEGASGLLPSGSLSTNFIIISATRSDQTAKETDDENKGRMGALTFALVKAFSDSGPNTTYRDVYERVRDVVSQRVQEQNPQIEGEMDTVLMKGTAQPTQQYILVSIDRSKNIILQAGSLHGMTVGSKFALYPNGTKSPQEGVKLADAEISELDATTALLKLTPEFAGKVQPMMLQTARAFEIERKYNESLLKVGLSQKDALPRQTEILNELKSFPLVEISNMENWDVQIKPTELTRGGENTILLQRADGSKLAEIKDDADLTKNVRLALEHEVRFRTVRELENSSPDLKIEMRVVPVEVETNQRGEVTKIVKDKEVSKTSDGQLQITEGDFVQIEVRNTGNVDGYVTILDLTPDGKIGPMFPHPRIQAPDNKIISDGQWKRIPLPFVFRITPPYGTEIFKAIATRDYTDFSPLLDARTVRGDNDRVKKAVQTPLGKILRSATLTQRSELGGAPPPTWATATVSFNVVKK